MYYDNYNFIYHFDENLPTLVYSYDVLLKKKYIGKIEYKKDGKYIIYGFHEVKH